MKKKKTINSKFVHFFSLLGQLRLFLPPIETTHNLHIIIALLHAMQRRNAISGRGTLHHLSLGIRDLRSGNDIEL